MTVWRRREETPAQPLAEDRKRLVHSYMDAEEERTRREALEQRDRQTEASGQARSPKAKLAAESEVGPQSKTVEDQQALPADLVDALQHEAAEEAARRIAAAEERARREATDEAARQIAAAAEETRRAMEEKLERRVAAAVEEARDQVCRELREQTARQVANAEERARSEAAEAAALQIAAAAERTHGMALAAAQLDAAKDETGREEVKRKYPPQSEAEGPMTDAVADATEKESPATLKRAREPSAETASGSASGNPTAGLPLYEWVQTAGHPDDADVPSDWTRALLRNRDKANAEPEPG